MESRPPRTSKTSILVETVMKQHLDSGSRRRIRIDQNQHPLDLGAPALGQAHTRKDLRYRSGQRRHAREGAVRIPHGRGPDDDHLIGEGVHRRGSLRSLRADPYPASRPLLGADRIARNRGRRTAGAPCEFRVGVPLRTEAGDWGPSSGRIRRRTTA